MIGWCYSEKGFCMEYTLITKTGKVMQFYLESVAYTYQRLYGGVVFSQRILDEPLTIALDLI